MAKKLVSKKTLLGVAQLGEPVLRKKARPVKDVMSGEIQSLIDNMIATCQDVDGVGIAAPQVYEPIRLFIVASKPSRRYPHAPYMEPTAIINPRILFRSKETVKDWEGCLSIPGLRALVPRHLTIKVEYTDRTGKKVKATYEDFIARIFQHEFDHIEGVVFLDRASTMDMVTEKEFQKLVLKSAGK